MTRELLYDLPAGWSQVRDGRVVDVAVTPEAALAEGVRAGAAQGPVTGDPTGATIVERVYQLGTLCERRSRWRVVGDPRTPAGWGPA